MTSFIDDNGNELDYNGKDFSMSKKSISFVDFKIKGDASVNIKIPNTAKNREILNLYGNNQVGGNFLSRQRFSRYVNGNILDTGFLAFTNIADDFLEGFYISGNSNWINLLSFNIKDINLNEESVLLDNAYENRNKTTGIVYPLIDVAFEGRKIGYGFYSFLWPSPGKPVNGNNLTGYLSESVPCYYLHSLLDGISRYSNLKITGSLLNDPVFNKIVIAPESMDLAWPDKQVEESRAFVTAADPDSLNAGAYTLIVFGGIIDQGSLTTFDNVASTWSAPYRCSLEIQLNLIFGSSQLYQIRAYVNGVDLNIGYNFHTASNKFNGSIFLRNVAANDLVSIYVYAPLATLYRSECTANFIIRKEISTQIFPTTFPNARSLVCPQAIIPGINATEIIKTLCVMFNVIPVYDVLSKTIQLDKMASIEKEDALDWSAYFVSSEEDYNGIAKNNYVKYAEGDDKWVKAFNKQSKKSYGGANIQTDYNTSEDRTLYTLPFAATKDFRNETRLGLPLPSIPYYTLEDDLAFNYTSVTNVGGLARFNGTGWTAIVDCVIRIADDNNLYNGYTGATLGTTSTTPYVDFVANSSGTIYVQKISKNTPKHRLLLVESDYDTNNLAVARVYISGEFSTLTTTNSTSFAWFDKERLSKPVDNLKRSLAFDTVQTKGYNQTLRDLFWGKLDRIMNSPKIMCKFLLPVTQYAKAQSNRFIYLKTAKLNGYFYLDSINNYIDGDNLVNVTLYSID